MNSSECDTDLKLIITGGYLFGDVVVVFRNAVNAESMTFSVSPQGLLEINSRLCWKGYFMNSAGDVNLC